ncbi:hypothetical protein VT84_18670 [Gemmata sp. SH-PL17]|uniref:hypothetical protein n=1 Tax=Gemmata sp. SH-PL17 TaxID=1630693 RepID=UPI00078B7C60|nr:hypothetical protein [Gemmata sp. SH-PL17]AMV26429.1 hypothetical protein VT84_18670 [Gemmata sp. SH-PL17]
MTKVKWLKCFDPHELLEFLVKEASERKLRLFACACCRRALHLVSDDRLPPLVQVAENLAEGPIKAKELKRAFRVFSESEQSDTGRSHSNLVFAIHSALKSPIDRGYFGLGESASCAFGWAVGNGLNDTQYLEATQQERRQQATLIRDIFGNPFRPVTFSSEWRTDTGLSLARQMYDSRNFSAMPILADALQDAGCDNDNILDHCRSEGPHVRGCWVIDLVLGKE